VNLVGDGRRGRGGGGRGWPAVSALAAGGQRDHDNRDRGECGEAGGQRGARRPGVRRPLQLCGGLGRPERPDRHHGALRRRLVGRGGADADDPLALAHLPVPQGCRGRPAQITRRRIAVGRPFRECARDDAVEAGRQSVDALARRRGRL
jgi:hypothetical protein